MRSERLTIPPLLSDRYSGATIDLSSFAPISLSRFGAALFEVVDWTWLVLYWTVPNQLLSREDGSQSHG